MWEQCVLKNEDEKLSAGSAQVKDSNGGSYGIHVTGQGHVSLFF